MGIISEAHRKSLNFIMGFLQLNPIWKSLEKQPVKEALGIQLNDKSNILSTVAHVLFKYWKQGQLCVCVGGGSQTSYHECQNSEHIIWDWDWVWQYAYLGWAVNSGHHTERNWKQDVAIGSILASHVPCQEHTRGRLILRLGLQSWPEPGTQTC